MRLGYTNSDMWRELVKRHIDDISKAQNIPLANMKWYAAFHDTTHHPHIHLIVYSSDPRQGYLTKEGMAAIRSSFANDIFHDDLQSVYQAQTLTRDELKALSENNMKEIVSQLGNGEVDERLVISIQKLCEQLKTTKGKKVYGYLPKDVKKTVDEIFLLLAQDKNIQELYDKWCEFEKAKYKMYTQKDKEFPVLIDNKEFKSVRNMIIRTVVKLNDEYENVSPSVIRIPEIESVQKPADSNLSVHDSEEIITVPIKAAKIPTIPTEPMINNVNNASLDNSIFAGTVAKLLVDLGSFIEDDNRRSRKNISRADRKLMSIIQRKKQELGIKSEGIDMNYEF